MTREELKADALKSFNEELETGELTTKDDIDVAIDVCEALKYENEFILNFLNITKVVTDETLKQSNSEVAKAVSDYNKVIERLITDRLLDLDIKVEILKEYGETMLTTIPDLDDDY